mmetsp:Transcript_38313/g.100474  ORF Transcript_38313/g.100474 Transcript_38313/m.100474 type:complete len:209 (-) Transcript_38313:115-741(-)
MSICRSFSTEIPMRSASSMSVGGRVSWLDRSRRALRRLLTWSCMCTGKRMRREWSAMAREMACRIHHVAYVDSRKPRDASYFSAALMRPIEPSCTRSCSVSPWLTYFLAIETTRRRLEETSRFLAFCIRFSSRRYSTAPPASPSSAAVSSSVTGRSSTSSSLTRVSPHCSCFWIVSERALTSSGERRRCLPIDFRYHRIESSPLCGPV